MIYQGPEKIKERSTIIRNVVETRNKKILVRLDVIIFRYRRQNVLVKAGFGKFENFYTRLPMVEWLREFVRHTELG